MERNVSIWWIRRDLRLADNPALQAALQASKEVIPLFIADPFLINSPSMAPQRLAFLWQALKSLDNDLKLRGNRLVLRNGKPAEVLRKIINETSSGKIFAHSDYSPYARKRDLPLANTLPIHWEGFPTLFHPGDVLKKDGTPYTVFTPFMRSWKEKLVLSHRDLHAAPEQLHRKTELSSEVIPVPSYRLETQFPVEEMHAHQRLAHFTRGDSLGDASIYSYHLKRDMMGENGTSQLSPYIKFGILSARQVVLAALDASQTAPDADARKGVQTWLNELIWREFYTSILYHFPSVLQSSFRPELSDIPWQADLIQFNAWCQGETGFPIVDAGMRELLSTGWMHNRARMITASFLVKNLLINWQWGEKWFLKHLLDADPASNNGGWQWTAGTGTDAAPYFRIFNPILQSKKYDPDGTYIRRWVPQLEKVPARYIHAPWEMPVDTQKTTACQIGKDYPYPIVELKSTRERALHAYAFAKDQYKMQSIS